MAHLDVARKNGKSTILSGCGVVGVCADGEPGADVFSAAADREQAAIVFDEAANMVRAAPALESRLKVYRRSIVHPSSLSSYKVLSRESRTKHGLNPHLVLFDELHTQRTRELWDTLTTGSAARRQPLIITATTAGYEQESICYKQRIYAEKVMRGEINDQEFLGLVFAADKDDDIEDPATWKKANPNLGISVSEEYIRAQLRRAITEVSFENTYRRLHLNQWTQQANRWLAMKRWDAVTTPVILEELLGIECWAGLDLASTTDIAAFVMVFVLGENFVIVPRFWVPEAGMVDRIRKDAVPYDAWVKKGFLKATPGDVIDYRIIVADIIALKEKFNIREVAFDRWNAGSTVTELQDAGFTMVPFGQGFASMSAPCKEFETLLLQKRLQHGGHPVLRWMAENVAVSHDPAGNIKPNKAKSTGRIDGIVAALMALDRSFRNGGASSTSVYETQGVKTL